MRHHTRLAIAVFTLWPAVAHAGGFYVPEIGPRATGLGGAVAAESADPSATFHNPAGLAAAEGTQLEVATGLFFPDVTFFRRPVVDPGTGETLRFDRVENSNPLIAAPFLGASHALGRGVTVGLAVYAPFGATLEFPTDGAQRHVITGLALRTVYVSPAVGVALPGGVSLGAAVDFIYGDLVLEQQNAIPYVTGDPEQYPDPDPAIEGSTRLEGKDPMSLGATVGAAWRSPGGRVRVGASVMTPVTLELEGEAHVENEAIAALQDESGAELQPAGRRSDDVRMALPLPLVARFGVAVAPARRWLVELDVNWQGWSRFEALTVDFVNEHELLPTPGAYLYDVRVENHWRDTWSVRLGVEAAPLARPLVFRAGVVWDQSPVDDRHFGLLTPDSDKLGVGGGVRWTTRLGGARGRIDVDVAALHLFLRERDIEPGDSEGTILNKPAPSFYHGVTRAGFDVVTLAVAWRY
jgi:long-chain fatty acid transport protein